MDSTPSKGYYTVAVIIGSTLGGYIPSWFGAGFFSMWGIFGSVVGGILGIYLAYKIYTSWIG